MEKMTITEALAKIKTINARLEKKRAFVESYVWRQEPLKDPIKDEGGSPVAIQKERQAITDLNELTIAIRRAIQDANSKETITIGKVTRSIADWLIWRRDVLKSTKNLLNSLRVRIEQARQMAMKTGGSVVEKEGTPKDIVVNINEKELMNDLEYLEEVEGTLDGLLSLKNATVTIEV